MDSEDTGRYSLIGSYGEDLGAVLMRLMACGDCGVAVANVETHDHWHKEPESPSS